MAGLYVLHARKHMLTFECPRFVELFRSWRQLLYIGAPAGATYLLMPATMAIITRMVAGYGTAAVAAAGAGGRIDMFALMVVMSLGSVLMPFVGQNWGARRFERVRAAHRCGHVFALGWGLLTMTILLLLAHPIANSV